MNKMPQRNETREHLLTTGESLCLQRGFTGMGLSQLLNQAQIPKGSFYYYFPSKEAFGVALLERYFVRYLQNLEQQLFQPADRRVSDYWPIFAMRSICLNGRAILWAA